MVYKIRIKKGDYELEIESEDLAFVNEKLHEFLPNPPPAPPPAATPEEQC